MLARAPTRECVALLAIVLATDACARKPSDDAKPATSSETAHGGVPDHVHLSAAVIKDANVQTAIVTLDILSAVLPLPGEIVADPDRSAKVSSPVAGRIEQVSFKEGSIIKKGDLLAVIRIPELGKLRAAYAAQVEKAKAARSNAERLKELAANRLAATQAQVDAQAQADALELEAKALGEQLATLGASGSGVSTLPLRAPVGGMVMTRDAIVGQPITPEQTLASIADLSEVWFLARVYEKDLDRVRAGARADVQLAAYRSETFRGAVEFVGRQIDPSARTFSARIRLANRGDLLSIGLSGTALVTTTDAAAKVAKPVVSRAAVADVGDKSVVFVRRGGDFDAREVTLGESAGGRVEVLTGVREGEEVVVQGVFAIKSAMLKSTFAE